VNSKEPVVLYRIRAFEKSGAATFSGIKTLEASRSAATSLSLYPNPATTAVSLSYAPGKEAVVFIRLSTVTGQHLSFRTFSCTATTRLIPLPEVQALQPGVYVVELTDAQNRSIGSAQLVKQ
jgi:hypothetical protein